MTISVFSRCFPATRRAYSSFFSSKPGGGRYFKPPNKPVVPTSTAPSTTNNNNNACGSNASNNANCAATSSATPKSPNSPTSLEPGDGKAATPGVGDGPNQMIRADTTEETPSNVNTNPDTQTPSFHPNFRQYHQPLTSHPIVNAKDFKLHQFFSLDRPLLLLSNPAAIFRSSSSTGSLFGSPLTSSSMTPALKDPNSLLFTGQATSPDDTVDASIDADAETARQLNHAITISRAGSMAEWERTLKTLGLDVSLEVDRVESQEEMAREWENVWMDSTKRKRRKKMKKHKLKKRRKATRAQRLKIGR